MHDNVAPRTSAKGAQGAAAAPPCRYTRVNTVQDIRALCTEHAIRMIDFKMIDIHGQFRHVTVPAERFDEELVRWGVGFDASNYGYAPVENSDMVFVPDLASARVDPFVATPTLSMLGNAMVIERNGNKPFDQYPRNVVAAAEQHLRRSGIADCMLVLPEFEFYLLDHAAFDVSPNRIFSHIDWAPSYWNSGDETERNLAGKVARQKGYHVAPPLDAAFDLRSDICRHMEAFGIPVKYHHAEVGAAGQFEVETELGPLSPMADNTVLTKYIIRNTARQHGKTVTFMPKPIPGEAGSGMHVHMLLTKGGAPVFADDAGYAGLSETALFFIGGLLKHIAALCAITNPSTNSYKRLVPGFEAPVVVGYATSNRSAVVRIPAYARSPLHRRFELRNPDATCCPHFAFAAILMAGIDGVQRRIDPRENGWGPYDMNLFHLPEDEKKKLKHLPASLDMALDALEADHDFLTAGGVFPLRLLEKWGSMKRLEAKEMSMIPHPAEFVRYFDL